MNSKLSQEHQYDDSNFFNYSYGRYFSNGVLVLTSIVFIVGLIFFVSGIHEFSPMILIGLILMALGFISYLPIEILQINNITKEYRVAIKLGSYIKGEWKPLGPIKYVSIVNMGKYIHLSGNEMGKKYKGDIIQECRLRLFKRAGYTIDIDDYKSKESAIYIGKIIAKGLELELLDATERPPMFIPL